MDEKKEAARVPDLNDVAFDADATLRMDPGALKILNVKCSEAAALRRKWSETDEQRILHEPSVIGKVQGNRADERYSGATLIGEGSTAKIYGMHDHNCEREVAVKILKEQSYADKTEEINRFLIEASVVASLEHPSIIPVYDLNCDDRGQAYLSMRRVRGKTLKEYISVKEAGEDTLQIPTQDELIYAFLKVCDALTYAHSRGHVHQDIKPENIMVGEFGEVFVIDWGASASGDGEVSLTPMYMSPQQAQGELPTARDDVFCLGATMFHCMLLRFPTSGTALEELWEKRSNGVIDPVTEEERRRIPAPLLAILLKTIEPVPSRRYQTIEALAQDLKNYQSGQAVSAHSDSIVAFLLRKYRRYRHRVNLVGVLLVGALIIGGLSYRQYRRTLSGWVVVEHQQLNNAERVLSLFHGPGEAPQMPASFDGLISRDGLLLPKYKWHWLRPRVEGDMTLELEFSWPDPALVDGMEIWLHTEPIGLPYLFSDPKGDRIQFGGGRGAMNYIQGNGTSNTSCRFEPSADGRYRAKVTRHGDVITAELNGEIVMQTIDSEPFGPEQSWIGFRTWADCGATLHSLTLSERVLPEYASPLEVAKTHLLDGFPDKAYKEYLRIESRYRTRMTREIALYRAAILAAQLGKDEEYEQLVTRFETTFPDSRYHYQVLQPGILKLWKNKKHREALEALHRIESLEERDEVLGHILRLPHNPLSTSVRHRFLTAIAQNPKRGILEIRGYGITDLSPLRGMDLAWLYADQNDIRSIEPLRGMRLMLFSCEDNQIRDLSPIADAPLIRLFVSGNPVVDMKSTSSQLEELEAERTQFQSLAEVNCSSLRILKQSPLPIHDLDPLRGLKRVLYLHVTLGPETDLSGLQGIRAGDMKLTASSDHEKRRILDFSFFGNNATVSSLSLQNCIIESWTGLDAVNGLRSLTLKNCEIKGTGSNGIEAPLNCSLSLSQTTMEDGGFLHAMKPKSVTFSRTNVQDLSFLDKPCSVVLYHNPRLPDSEMKKLLAKWLTLPLGETERAYVDQLRLMLAIQKGDKEELHRQAFVLGDHRYLSLPARINRADAMAVAEKVGAHLASFETEAEYRQLLESKKLSGHCWLSGVRLHKDSPATWHDGTPINWDLDPKYVCDTFPLYLDNYFLKKCFGWSSDPSKSIQALLEWD